MGNPFFKHSYDRNNNESLLYKGATDELVEIFGIDFKYLPKTLVKPDYIFGEDTLKEFNSHRDVTFFIENYEQYDGIDDMFSKFGFEVDNRLMLLISQTRFKEYTDLDEPQNDDLIFHPNSQKIFRITHYDVNENFYQFNGDPDRFRITCELHTPSYEEYDTNIDEVDQLTDDPETNNDLEKDSFAQQVEDVLNLDEADIFEHL